MNFSFSDVGRIKGCDFFGEAANCAKNGVEKMSENQLKFLFLGLLRVLFSVPLRAGFGCLFGGFSERLLCRQAFRTGVLASRRRKNYLDLSIFQIFRVLFGWIWLVDWLVDWSQKGAGSNGF